MLVPCWPGYWWQCKRGISVVTDTILHSHFSYYLLADNCHRFVKCVYSKLGLFGLWGYLGHNTKHIMNGC